MRKLTLFLCLVLLVFMVFIPWGCLKKSPGKINLSPSNWPKGDLEKYTELNRVLDRPHPLSTGTKGMIAGTSGALAVRAGLEALKQGGTAADAAITTSLAQISLAAGCWVSYTGFMTMVYYEAATGKVQSMDAAYNTVEEETDPLSIPPLGTPSGRSALVPGFMAGIEATYQRFGKLPFAQLFEPAIYFAENGFVINALLQRFITERKDVLVRLPEIKQIFTKADGELYREDDLFKQPQLAETLRKVATLGADYMYRGEWAKKFVDAVRREGGKMTLKDLADYKVQWGEPVQTNYKGYDIFAIGSPNIGGIKIVEALNILEVSDQAAKFGQQTKSPEALYWLVQTSRVGQLLPFLTPELLKKYLPEGDFSASSRAKKETAKLIWSKMEDKSLFGVMKEFLEMSQKAEAAAKKKSDHSDAVVAVDQYGNVAAVCHTINTIHWGTTGIFVDGISVNDSAAIQQQLVKAAGSGVRLPDPTNPFLVLKNGKPLLASSSIGSGLHEATLQNAVNILDFGMDPKTSVDSPTFLSPLWGTMELTTQGFGEGDFSQEILDAVKAMGLEIRVLSKDQQGLSRGYWIGIKIDPETGKLQGAVTKYFNGLAEGY